MRNKRSLLSLALLFTITGVWSRSAHGEYRAYSLKEAERLLRFNGADANSPALRNLASITRPLGCVWDSQTGDLIIFGDCDPNTAPLGLDDLVAAMRAWLRYGDATIVDIQPPSDPSKPEEQPVKFGGGIANTAFGRDLLDADVTLKKLGLGILRTGNIWNVRSYFARVVAQWEQSGIESPMESKFWFEVDHDATDTAQRRGVAMLVQRLHLKVTCITSGAGNTAKGVTPPLLTSDENGQAFANDMTRGLDDLMAQFPQLRRLDQLHRVAAIAAVLKKWRELGINIDSLNYFLDQYSMTVIPTSPTYHLLSAEQTRQIAGLDRKMTISGGVDLSPMIKDVSSLSYSALHDLVLKSRPGASALAWTVPFGDSLDQICGLSSGGVGIATSAPVISPGTTFRTTFSDTHTTFATAPFHPPDLNQSFTFSAFPDHSFTPPPVPHVGGVMLSGKARVAGANGQVSLEDGRFSLVVQGQNASLAPKDFDRFVTALWAVYYCKDVPGISIDPIGPGVNKHMVRYIGHVINSDLGRVMRDADYQMKKWAVGTERPDVLGFATPDDWAAIHGADMYGAYRRFWFVPEDLNFHQGGGMLLYTNGNMRVRTELMVDGKRGQTTPEDDNFAQFFTQHYGEISQKYPIYSELFEYAKMVALCRYLKEQGVPLHWFLMANRDHILTEDSPSTVLELAHHSDHFENVEIKGGVSLEAGGHYVQDATAMQAIAEAMQHQRERPATEQAPVTPQSPDKQQAATPAANVPYSAVAQKSLTSGRDAHGIRYQTDAAFRMGTEPALEMVRYFDGRHLDRGMFGNGWNLLLPYFVEPGRDAKEVPVGSNKLILPATTVVHNLLSGVDETLYLDDHQDKYSLLGYVPQSPANSSTIGVFLTNAAIIGADDYRVPACRLADKIGNEFTFDQRGLLAEMSLGDGHYLTYTYARKQTRTIVRPTVVMQRLGDETVDFGALAVPKRLALSDLDGNQGLVLLAGKDGRYYPESSGNPHVLFAELSLDGKSRLFDDQGNIVYFTERGAMEAIDFSPQTHVVQSMKYEHLGVDSDKDGKPILDNNGTASVVRKVGQQVEFDYLMDLTGMLRVGRAKITSQSPPSTSVLLYDYDQAGYLVGVKRQRR